DLVVVTVREVKNFGAFVTLNEFKDREGFIHITEVASGWVKYIRDYLKEGQVQVCKVLRVNPSKGHIDLSFKQVNEHQHRMKIQEWKNEQKAEKLFEILAEKMKMDMGKAYQEFGYRLIDTFGTLFGAFEECTINPICLSEHDFNGPWTETFIQLAKDNISPPYISIDGYLEMNCPTSEGIIPIKNALLEASKVDNDVEIQIQYVSAPKYRLQIRAMDYKVAEDAMREAANRAIEYIKKHNGSGVFHRKET
ncbi:translation initiation factor IF-2 subunit alpha, partial [[Eubacterium] cellulosolvens]